MRFAFVGDFSLDTSKERSIGRGTTVNGTYLTLRPSIISAKNNRGFCDIFGMKQDVIQTKGLDDKDMDVPWEERFNPDVIKLVADYRKYVVSVNGERHVFITKYDLNEWVLDHLEELNGKRVLAVGKVKKDFYQGTIRDKFPIDNIYEIGENDDRKNILGITGTIYWDKEGIDISDFKDNKKIYINGYTEENISKTIGNKFVPQQFVLNCNKINFENEKHIRELRARLSQLGLDYDNGKIINKLKKGYVCNEFEIRMVNGAEEIEFTIDQCTEVQKTFIDLGIKTLDDFRPRGKYFGDRIIEYQIKNPTLLGKYNKGIIDYNGTSAEFEDSIYVPAQNENAEDVFTNAMNPPEENSDDEIDDLF